jgi:hypothetical protein
MALPKNWKTSLAGVLLLGFLAYKFYLDPNALSTDKIMLLLTAGGFFASGDHDSAGKQE